MPEHDRVCLSMTRTTAKRRNYRKDATNNGSIAMTLIEQRLYHLGLTRRAVAQRCNVTPAAVTYWINGTNLPSPQKAKVLARVLKWTVEYLLSLLQPNNNPQSSPSPA